MRCVPEPPPASAIACRCACSHEASVHGCPLVEARSVLHGAAQEHCSENCSEHGSAATSSSVNRRCNQGHRGCCSTPKKPGS